MQFQITIEATKPATDDHKGKAIALFATDNLDPTSKAWQHLISTQVHLAIRKYELAVAFAELEAEDDEHAAILDAARAEAR